MSSTDTPALLISGTFVSTPILGELEILEDHLLAVNPLGYITSLSPLSSPKAAALLLAGQGSQDVEHIVLPPHSFLLPTFTDLHLHAPQFLYAGTGLDLPLMVWLEKFAFRAEERLDGDEKLAKLVYERLGRRMIECGTGAGLIFGTINPKTNLILASTFLQLGLRAYIGKLSMDQNSPPTYIEPTPATSLASASAFIESMRSLTSPLPPHRRLVHPVLTPRFVPTCSDELLEGLGELAKKEGMRIQSHMSEARDQVDWVKETRGTGDVEVFERCCLLNSSTTQAHCTFLPQPTIDHLAELGTSIAHCPLSNAYFSSQIFPLRECLDASIPIGLGSDIAGGYQLDLQVQMRQAVVVARLRDSQVKEDFLARGEAGNARLEEEEEEGKDLRVSWKESLYLATRGGAMALNENRVGGRFGVGEAFDGQLIQLVDPGTSRGTGSLDFFDLEVGVVEGEGALTFEQMMERWWCNGDGRNRKGVWVQGRRLM